MGNTERQQFMAWARKRFMLRGYMSLIVSATGLSGAATNTLLFGAGVTSFWARYPAAVVVAYVVFLGLMRLWLHFMARRERVAGALLGNVAEGAADVTGEALGSVLESAGGTLGRGARTIGGGGRFGGAGASATFEAPPGGVGGAIRAPSIDVGLDGETLLLIIAFAVLVLSVLLASGYLIWEAPSIMAETLFEFSLASALLRRLKKEEKADWLGRLLRLTWVPFLVVLVVATAFSVLAGKIRPDAHRLVDLLKDAPEATVGP